MHDLPKDLTNSLRSYRGSVYGSVRREPSDVDLEKGPEDYGEKMQALSPAQSSLMLHPALSSRSLRHLMKIGKPEAPQPQQQRIQLQTHQEASEHQDHAANASSSPKAVTKRQATFQNPPPQTPASAKLSLFHNAPKIDDPDPASDRLDDDMTPLTTEHFYELIGMRPPSQGKSGLSELPKDLATPHGLYGTIRAKKRYVETKYRVFDIFTYVFLAAQLFLSAVFIVLGSIRSNYHIAIAVLGAISAVISGIMSLMKGQGLPNRLRQVRDDLQNVLFAAEELYWDVQAGRGILFKDIVNIREMYLRVLAEARRNHPDSWTKGADDVAKGVSVQARGGTGAVKATAGPVKAK